MNLHDAHDERHDELLHAHLAGDVPGDDPSLRARLTHCTACSERLEELRSLTELLEQVGGAQRGSLAPPAGAAPTPGRERVAATLRDLAAGRAPAAPPAPVRRATLWRVGLAAASVLAAGWIVKTLLPPPTDAREDVLLGDNVDRSATPNGTVGTFDAFDWNACPSDAAYVRVKVWRSEQSVTEEPIAQARVDRLPWRPSTADLESMGSAIRWQAIAYDFQGNPIDSVEGQAILSSSSSD
jgi:hypothetical protein